MPTELHPEARQAAPPEGPQALGERPAGAIEPGTEEAERFTRQRQRRNWAVAAGLVGFVVLIFLVTLVRLSGNIAQMADRPL